MRASMVKGLLISFDAEKSEIQLVDRDENEMVTLKIGPDKFPYRTNWDNYVGKEFGAIVVDGKTEKIFQIEERKIETPEKRDENEPTCILDRSEFKKQMKDLVWHIGGTIQCYDFSLIGSMDFLINNLYISWYYGAKDVHTTDDVLSDERFCHLPKGERKHITRFLEYCAENGAAIYWRDFRRFTWCVLNEETYKRCCEKFGFKKGDFYWYSFAEMGMRHISS